VKSQPLGEIKWKRVIGKMTSTFAQTNQDHEKIEVRFSQPICVFAAFPKVRKMHD
jgi:hypothetical protein